MPARLDARQGIEGIQVRASGTRTHELPGSPGGRCSSAPQASPSRRRRSAPSRCSASATSSRSPSTRTPTSRSRRASPELGQINFPLIGAVTIGGLSVSQAQALIEKRLRDGGFVLKPQVTIQTVQIRSSQVSILGQVAKPGRYPDRDRRQQGLGDDRRRRRRRARRRRHRHAGRQPRRQADQARHRPAARSCSRAAPTSTCSVENGDIIYVDRAPTLLHVRRGAAARASCVSSAA